MRCSYMRYPSSANCFRDSRPGHRRGPTRAAAPLPVARCRCASRAAKEMNGSPAARVSLRCPGLRCRGFGSAGGTLDSPRIRFAIDSRAGDGRRAAAGSGRRLDFLPPPPQHAEYIVHRYIRGAVAGRGPLPPHAGRREHTLHERESTLPQQHGGDSLPTRNAALGTPRGKRPRTQTTAPALHPTSSV